MQSNLCVKLINRKYKNDYHGLMGEQHVVVRLEEVDSDGIDKGAVLKVDGRVSQYDNGSIWLFVKRVGSIEYPGEMPWGMLKDCKGVAETTINKIRGYAEAHAHEISFKGTDGVDVCKYFMDVISAMESENVDVRLKNKCRELDVFLKDLKTKLSEKNITAQVENLYLPHATMAGGGCLTKHKTVREWFNANSDKFSLVTRPYDLLADPLFQAECKPSNEYCTKVLDKVHLKLHPLDFDHARRKEFFVVVALNNMSATLEANMNVYFPVVDVERELKRINSTLDVRFDTQPDVNKLYNEIKQGEVRPVFEIVAKAGTDMVYVVQSVYWKAEKMIASFANWLAMRTVDELVADTSEVSARVNDQQREALVHVIKNPLTIIRGPPGVGKSYIIQQLISAMKVNKDFKTYRTVTHPGYGDPTTVCRVMFCAFTGIAVRNLSKACNDHLLDEYLCVEQFNTIHRTIGLHKQKSPFSNIPDPLSELKLLVMDEGSMADSVLTARLFGMLPMDIHVVIMGDDKQLQSISPGCVFSDMCMQLPDCVHSLNVVERKTGFSEIHLLVNQIKPGFALDESSFEGYNGVHFEVLTQDKLMCQVVSQYVEALENETDCHIITPKNATRDKFNRIIQSELHKGAGTNNKHVLFGRADDPSKMVLLYPGDKVVCKKNEYADKCLVMNGEVGTVLSIEKNTMMKHQLIPSVGYATIQFDKGIMLCTDTPSKIRDGNVKTHDCVCPLNTIDLAYALTIHKSQGSTHSITIVIIEESTKFTLDYRMLRTAFSRPKQGLFVYISPRVEGDLLTEHNKRMSLQSEGFDLLGNTLVNDHAPLVI